MRLCRKPIALLCLICLIAGCGGGSDYGPTIDEFHGKLTAKGQPVSFPEDERVLLQLFFVEKGENFGIPIQPDGTFDIGWMPIGKYTAVLERRKAISGDPKGPLGMPKNYPIAQGLTIVDGQTEYTVELGARWKPPKR